MCLCLLSKSLFGHLHLCRRFEILLVSLWNNNLIEECRSRFLSCEILCDLLNCFVYGAVNSAFINVFECAFCLQLQNPFGLMKF